MYQTFYHLSADPFRLTPDPRFCFFHQSYAKAWAYLQYALWVREGFIVITGQPGTGKTTLIEALTEELRTRKYSRIIGCHLIGAPRDPMDLLRSIASSLEIDPDGLDRSALIDELSQFYITQRRGGGSRGILIIDEAQDISNEVVEELRLLADLQWQRRPLLQVVLIGQEELKRVLDDPELAQFQQRVVAASHLEQLTQKETRDYIEHRLTRADWHGVPIFSGEAVNSIYYYSGGLPRQINKLCGRLMLHGYTEEKQALGSDDVLEIIEELYEEHLVPSEQTGVDPEAADQQNWPQEYTDYETESEIIEQLAIQAPAEPNSVEPRPSLMVPTETGYGDIEPPLVGPRRLRRSARKPSKWRIRVNRGREIWADMKLNATLSRLSQAGAAMLAAQAGKRSLSTRWISQTSRKAGDAIVQSAEGVRPIFARPRAPKGITALAASLIVGLTITAFLASRYWPSGEEGAQLASTEQNSTSEIYSTEGSQNSQDSISENQNTDIALAAVKTSALASTSTGIQGPVTGIADSQSSTPNSKPKSYKFSVLTEGVTVYDKSDAPFPQISIQNVAIEPTPTMAEEPETAQPEDIYGLGEYALNAVSSVWQKISSALQTRAAYAAAYAANSAMSDQTSDPVSVDPRDPGGTSGLIVPAPRDIHPAGTGASTPAATGAQLAESGSVHEIDSAPATVKNVEATVEAASPAGSRTRLPLLLSNAQLALKEDRLTIPGQNNAYYFYQKVLEIQPDSSEANRGIDQIAERYSRLAQEAMAEKAEEKALSYITRGLRVKQDYSRLVVLRQQIERDSIAGEPSPAKNIEPGMPLITDVGEQTKREIAASTFERR